MRLIDADTVVHWQSYDDEHETFPDHEGTIAEFLDAITDEGCRTEGRWRWNCTEYREIDIAKYDSDG